MTNKKNLINTPPHIENYPYFSSTYSLKNESGRTLTEILAVLAIMAVLAITGMAAYQRSLRKDRANKIIHDGRLLETLISFKQEKTNGWQTEASFLTETPYDFTYLIDAAKRPYEKVSGVEKEVCEILVRSNKELVGFYTIDSEPFTECGEENEIVLDFDKKGAIAQCLATKDCDDLTGTDFDGFCNGDYQCQECDELSNTNDDRTQCVCNSTVAVSCENSEQQGWCCPIDRLCSDTVGECLEDFMCKGSFSQSIADNTCHYTFSQGTTENKCHYTFSQSTTENKCHYTFSITDGVASFTEEKGCNNEKYCRLSYPAETCTGNISNTSTDLWGACNAPNDTIESCSYTSASFTELKGCNNGKYCRLSYPAETCTGNISNTSTDLWGACNAPNDTVESCSYTSASFTEEKGCDNGKYCRLSYTSNTCTNTNISNNATDLWGACNAPNDTVESCSYTTTSFSDDIPCPGQYYCNLIWKNTDYGNVENTSTNIYGRCSFFNEYNTSHPN